jgi:6-pyruvoyltetrahydropterin/6-carboxytetrahydropterin synthase
MWRQRIVGMAGRRSRNVKGQRWGRLPLQSTMFELTVQDEFCAAHALVVSGVREATHGHNWRVEVVIEGSTLDADGLLCDFHTAEAMLSQVIEPFQNADLNKVEPFVTLNPSAENVARHIAMRLAELLDASLAPHARVRSVSVTEAPGCKAKYIAG